MVAVPALFGHRSSTGTGVFALLAPLPRRLPWLCRAGPRPLHPCRRRAAEPGGSPRDGHGPTRGWHRADRCRARRGVSGAAAALRCAELRRAALCMLSRAVLGCAGLPSHLACIVDWHGHSGGAVCGRLKGSISAACHVMPGRQGLLPAPQRRSACWTCCSHRPHSASPRRPCHPTTAGQASHGDAPASQPAGAEPPLLQRPHPAAWLAAAWICLVFQPCLYAWWAAGARSSGVDTWLATP